MASGGWARMIDDVRRRFTRLALLAVVGLSLFSLGGCYYRYPYKVKKKPSSCPYQRPAKKAP